MKIEKATTADCKTIAALAVQIWLNTYAKEGIREVFSDYIWSELTPEKFTDRLKNDSREIYLLKNSNHSAGFIEINFNSVCEFDNQCIVEIEKLYIQENFCGKSEGSALLEFVFQLCEEQKLKKVWLSVYEKNERAIKFYQKHNFSDAGIIYFELGAERHKNFVMKKTLAS